MIVRSSCAALGLVLMSCGGAPSAQDSTTPHTHAGPGDPTCALQTLDRGESPAFAAIAYERYGLLLPGAPEAWHAECPSEFSNYIYFGELDLSDGTLAASLEDVGTPEMTPFDEAAFLAGFSERMLAIEPDSRVTERASLGIETLSNGHPVWFASMTLVQDGTTLHTIHGYSARPLSSERVLLAHVSRGAQSLEPEAKQSVARLLEGYGTVAELLDEAAVSAGGR